MLGQNTDSPAGDARSRRRRASTRSAGIRTCRSTARKPQLTANTQDWSHYYLDVVNKALAGTWTGGRITRWGLKEKAIVLTKLNPAVPADVAQLFEQGNKRPSPTARWCRSRGR